MARFLEDFEEGQEVWSPGRTITEADVMAFAGLSGDYNPAHTDYEFARKGPFGRPIAHGLLALIVSAGLAERDGGLDGTAIAMLGVNWTFKKPVFFGDTIRLKLIVTSTRRAGKGERGIIVRSVSVYNQSDELVQEGAFTTMVKARSAG
jgi:acyl dehydratase